jgi:hypothetical protein
MPIAQSQLVHKNRTEGKTAGGYHAACGHLAMALEDPFELLMEILNRYRAGFMQDAVGFHPVIGMRARTSCGRHHEATGSRAQMLEVGAAIMMAPQQKAEFHGEFLE